MGVKAQNMERCICTDGEKQALTRFNQDFYNKCLKKQKEFGNRKILQVIKEA